MEKWAIVENYNFYRYETKNLTQEEKSELEEMFFNWCRAESEFVSLIRKMGKVDAKRSVERSLVE